MSSKRAGPDPPTGKEAFVGPSWEPLLVDVRRCVLPAIRRCSHDLASMRLALAYNSIASQSTRKWSLQ
jgi:hypothetical protein